jgi:cell wall assembly regulator SMI1
MADLVDMEKLLTDDDYKDFERIFHRQLPPSFKARYMAHNGGCPAEEDVESGQWGLPVHGFNPIRYGSLPIEKLVEDIGNIEPEDRRFGSWEKFSYVPFAYDAGGNTIFISLRDDDYGHVYIYAPDGGNIKNICPSFEEFRRRLCRPRIR